MFRSLRNAVLLAAAMALSVAAPAAENNDRRGHPATPADIAAWDIDVRYDGAGLPAGQGTVQKGEEIFAQICAGCHGEFGEGLGRFPALIGEGEPKRRIASLWPYAATLFDYIRRAMPFGDAQSLTANQVYSLTALILNMNGLWEDDDVLNQANLAKVEMPNRGGFLVNDPRPDTSNIRCMRECGKAARIVSKAVLVDNPD